jgi:hypothetical protein
MTHTEILQEIQNNAGNPERVYELTKAALAQDETSSSRAAQEPVARLLKFIGKDTYPEQGYTIARTHKELPKDSYPDMWEEGDALYTTPQKRPLVGLTPDERYECIHESVDAWDIAEAVEAKLKEKNKWMTKNYLTL